MRTLLLSSVLLCLGLAACADHSGSVVATDGPRAPVNEPDTRIIDPGTTTPGGTGGSGGSTTEGGTNGSGNTGGGNTGGSTSGGEPGGTGNSGSGGEPGGPPSGQEGGGQGGSPVPEPGTLLLVGTGLAGLAGAALRRRQQKKA